MYLKAQVFQDFGKVPFYRYSTIEAIIKLKRLCNCDRILPPAHRRASHKHASHRCASRGHLAGMHLAGVHLAGVHLAGMRLAGTHLRPGMHMLISSLLLALLLVLLALLLVLLEPISFSYQLRYQT
jgi:hypothetical protein